MESNIKYLKESHVMGLDSFNIGGVKDKINRPLTITVVIPTWRRMTQLVRLLKSLSQQVRLPDEVIVACRHNDYDSINAVEDWAKSSPLAFIHKVVKVYDEGHLPPLLAALGVCKSEIFCQIDDDAIPHEDWLMYIEKDFNDPSVGGIGGKVIHHIQKDKAFDSMRQEVETPGKLSWFGRSGKFDGSNKTNGNLFEADCFMGGNMAFRTRALINSIDLTLNGGSAISYETDIALNVRRKGFKLFYDPRVIVHHYPAPRKIEATRGWNSKECFWYAHNLTYICFKHLSWYGKLGFIFYFFIGGSWGCPGLLTYLLSLILGCSVSWREQFLPSLRGRFAGLKSYFRISPEHEGLKSKSERKKNLPLNSN